jgi:hypothetical protein
MDHGSSMVFPHFTKRKRHFVQDALDFLGILEKKHDIIPKYLRMDNSGEAAELINMVIESASDADLSEIAFHVTT